MCEQCLVKPLVWRNVLDGWSLIQATVDGSYMKAGQWGLVEINDPTFVWDFRPIPDPTAGMSEDEEEEFYETQTEAVERLIAHEREFRDVLLCSPVTGWSLINACISSGFSPREHGLVDHWLLNHLGHHILINQPDDEQ
jgi:hypothetical protein